MRNCIQKDIITYTCEVAEYSSINTTIPRPSRNGGGNKGNGKAPLCLKQDRVLDMLLKSAKGTSYGQCDTPVRLLTLGRMGTC